MSSLYQQGKQWHQAEILQKSIFDIFQGQPRVNDADTKTKTEVGQDQVKHAGSDDDDHYVSDDDDLYDADDYIDWKMPVCKSYSTAAEADKQLCKESDLERVALDLNLVFILIM